jgi:hypothetical protein
MITAEQIFLLYIFPLLISFTAFYFMPAFSFIAFASVLKNSQTRNRRFNVRIEFILVFIPLLFWNFLWFKFFQFFNIEALSLLSKYLLKIYFMSLCCGAFSGLLALSRFILKPLPEKKLTCINSFLSILACLLVFKAFVYTSKPLYLTLPQILSF